MYSWLAGTLYGRAAREELTPEEDTELRELVAELEQARYLVITPSLEQAEALHSLHLLRLYLLTMALGSSRRRARRCVASVPAQVRSSSTPDPTPDPDH